VTGYEEIEPPDSKDDGGSFCFYAFGRLSPQPSRVDLGAIVLPYAQNAALKSSIHPHVSKK
jgi:hypothetical protein